MTIWQQQAPSNIWIVKVHGRLDQSLNLQLEENLTGLLNGGHHRLVVDLSEVSYINSGGLRCLVSAWRQARQQSGNLVLCSLNTRLQEIFSMVGFDKVFQIYLTCEAAQEALQE